MWHSCKDDRIFGHNYYNYLVAVMEVSFQAIWNGDWVWPHFFFFFHGLFWVLLTSRKAEISWEGYFANKMIIIEELLENFIMSSVSVYDILHCDLIRSVSMDEQLLENTGHRAFWNETLFSNISRWMWK